MSTVGPREPGETREAYIARVVAAAPPLTPELARRIAKLLPMPAVEKTDAGAKR